MSDFRRRLILLAVLFLAQGVAIRPLVGQTQRPLTPRWTEQLRPRTPLSGILVPGIMSGDPEALARTDTITLRLPDGAAGPVCVSVQSQDGRYSAQTRLQIPGASRIVSLAGPSRYRGELRRYRAGQLAISATLGGDCRDDLATHVVPHWGAGPSAHDDIYLYINSRDYTDVRWRGPDGALAMARCPEAGDEFVVYSRVCRIPAAALGTRTTLTIRQRRDGRTFVYDSVFVGGPR